MNNIHHLPRRPSHQPVAMLPVHSEDTQSLDSQIEQAMREAEDAVRIGPWGLLALAVFFVGCIGYWSAVAA